MCGIVGLHLRDGTLYPRLGRLLTGMINQLGDRGPDSAGMAIYGDPHWSPLGHAVVSVLGNPLTNEALATAIWARLGVQAEILAFPPTTVIHAPVSHAAIIDAIREVTPGAGIIGFGDEITVLKGVGHPREIARSFGLPAAQGWQGIAHTRMATESAVTAEGSHPFSVGHNQCLVHNGSFSNHASVRRDLQRHGLEFDSDNDTEVAARFIAKHLADGVDLEKALLLVRETFDGFYTLLVSTADSFAVVRDAIACKPAVIAETDRWVAVASEYRALAHLPGIRSAHVFEPEPQEVYAWHRR